MTFQIDTGFQQPQTAINYVADWLRDQCPADYTDAQIIQAYAHHLIGHMSAERGDARRPVKLATIREHLTSQWSWPFLRCLATENPGLFDEVILAYAERVNS